MRDWIEPLGLVTGPAVSNSGLPLQGGPLRFLLARRSGVVMPAEAVPEPWRGRLTTRPPDFAGLPDPGRPLVMGIVNVTPDSFSGDGLAADQARAIAQGEAMREAGADILDIGGESTRPGAEPVPPEEEMRRILPVIRALALIAPVSVDTRNAATMAAALVAGARIVNDVTALRHDPEALRVVAEAAAPVILMHMPTTDPRSMQAHTGYRDAALEVAGFLADRVEALEAAGIPRVRIAVDPGIGFGKTLAGNLALVDRLPLLAGIGCPILLGASRKGFLGRIAGVPEAGRRLAPSLAVALAGAGRGAAILRVHDVAETVQALRVWQASLSGDMPPAGR
ncbi:dihydropteroate synthase [Belnapia sp. T6]|uniref:dihydropteroate synthase n=1 Tax=Belnapia mucosa TaxID=2804532 RepID=A0ABS1V8L2_9PROT|nr:dihydropteroate synthase [Belnapia mucosa]MBL6456683.1 dihydropteroate synthase [Belnapia mucosa]